MKAIVVEKSAMRVIGLTLHTSFKDGRNKTEIPPFFHKVLDEGLLDRVPDRLNANQLCVFKMERNNPDFDYTMGVEVSKADDLPESMELIYLPAAKYVTVKTVKRGPEDVGKAFEFIFKSWIPGSIYMPSGKPAFIYYDYAFFEVFNQYGYAGNPEATVFVPIKPLFIKRILGFLGLKKFANAG
jgi:predicted transcriptional regulator YdeE